MYIPCVSIMEIICSDDMFEQPVELPKIDMDKNLSVQIKCFKTINWFVPFMFPYTDGLPTCNVLHLYG